jgi:uncharacterized protein (DUF4213/DUF364 family)
MSVAEKIKKHLLPKAKGIKVMDVRVGLVYTAVQMENGKAGVAFNFHEHLSRRCNFFEGLHPLAGREAPDLLELLDSTDKIETAVALATANALSNTMRSGLLKGDILKHLPIRPKDKVGMVGYFAPIVPRLKKRASAVMIFEQIKEKRGDLLPEEEAYRLLPQCQVALITSTSIVNHTVDQLLDAARSCRQVALLGASTPLIPEALSGTPVSFLSGVIVDRPKEILRIVSEGGGMRFFKDNIKKVNLPLAKAID